MQLNERQLSEIRELAIRLFLDRAPGRVSSDLRFDMIVEATVTYLKQKGMINDEETTVGE